MPKKAVSLTLEQANLLWLRGRTAALGHASLSETVDRIVCDARAGRLGVPTPPRTVADTIDIAADDPALERADEVIRGMVAGSLSRPVLVREDRSSWSSRAPKRVRTRTPRRG